MLMPPWRFVSHDWVFRGRLFCTVLLVNVQRSAIWTFSWWLVWKLNNANHPPWPSWLQKVEPVRYLSHLKVTGRNLRAYLLGGKTTAGFAIRRPCTIIGWLTIIDCEFGAKKIWAVKRIHQLSLIQRAKDWLIFDHKPQLHIKHVKI